MCVLYGGKYGEWQYNYSLPQAHRSRAGRALVKVAAGRKHVVEAWEEASDLVRHHAEGAQGIQIVLLRVAVGRSQTSERESNEGTREGELKTYYVFMQRRLEELTKIVWLRPYPHGNHWEWQNLQSVKYLVRWSTTHS